MGGFLSRYTAQACLRVVLVASVIGSIVVVVLASNVH